LKKIRLKKIRIKAKKAIRTVQKLIKKFLSRSKASIISLYKRINIDFTILAILTILIFYYENSLPKLRLSEKEIGLQFKISRLSQNKCVLPLNLKVILKNSSIRPGNVETVYLETENINALSDKNAEHIWFESGTIEKKKIDFLSKEEIHIIGFLHFKDCNTLEIPQEYKFTFKDNLGNPILKEDSEDEAGFYFYPEIKLPKTPHKWK